MRSRAVGLAFFYALSSAGAQQTAPHAIGRPPHAFRVCSDPDNLPFSDQQRQGFENKIAALLASDLGDSLSYVWFPTRRGFVRMTLGSEGCDIIMGAPQGYDLVLPTTPYYRSAYVAVTRRDRNLHITSLDDSLLKSITIGVNTMGDNYENTPPAHALGARGIYQHIVGFPTFYNAEQRPGDIVDAVAKGKIDVAIVWGPVAGYFAKRASVPLDVTVLPDTDRATGFPFAYGVTIGVRRVDRGLRDTLNDALARRRSDIDAILRDFGVPTVPMPSAATP
jgi:quinoprotein dehydrogenase-associated probable ABC transporter substrate-binding protein